MSLTRPSLQTIIDRISADFKATFGASFLATRSVLQVIARVLGGAVHLTYGYIDNLGTMLFVSTAVGSYLDRKGSEYGVLRNAAVAAKGNIVATGTVGATIPAGSILADASGYQFSTDALATIGLGGTVTVAVTAVVAGQNSNEVASTTLTFSSPIVGVNTTATVDSAAITGGTDLEVDTDYRTRILARMQFAPQGGCANDYVTWAKEVAGVTRAWVYPLYQGVGTLALFFVRDNDASIIPDAAEVAVVDTYVREHVDSRGITVGAPVGAGPGLFVLAPTPVAMNFSIALYPNTSAVQAAVLVQLNDLLYRRGYPGQTIYWSEIDAAISLATGEQHHRLTYPANDVVLAYNQVAILGAVTWSNY